ncbi:MAG: outer membrane beta-barrel protein [Fulvivirga sp.]|uniref:outer membrane beta-barrel protein n=1 Tax=Fulvivirga sp. TaxID=1931237 RepID=UPI0032EEE51F
MKYFSVILFTIMLASSQNDLVAQNNWHKINRIIMNAGPNASNLINSSAPHKTIVYGLYSTGSTHFEEYQYKTSLTEDIKFGFEAGLGLEVMLTEKLNLILFINYGTRGIDLNYSSVELDLSSSTPGTVEQSFERNITNNYLLVPITIRRQIGNSGLFLDAGIYTGILLSSKVRSLDKKIVSHESGYRYEFQSQNNIDYNKLDLTRKFDLGFSLGIGYEYHISKIWAINLGIFSNIGLLTIDSKNDNEYNYSLRPNGLGAYPGDQLNWITEVESKNYYGLNSNATNVSLSLKVGVAYNLSSN